MGSGINNNAFLAGLLGGVGDHMLTQEERHYQEKQNELKLKRSVLASLQADPNSTPQAQALALQGLLASPDQPKAKGIRGVLGGKQAGAVSPLDDVINQIKGMPAQSQSAAPPIQIPAIPSAPQSSAAPSGNPPWSEVPPIPVPGMSGSFPNVMGNTLVPQTSTATRVPENMQPGTIQPFPPKLGMTGAPPQLPQETPGMPAVPGLHKSPEELYQEAVMGAGAKTEGQYGAREKFGRKFVQEKILRPEDLPDFVASQTFGSNATKPTTTFSPPLLVDGKTVREIIINGQQSGKYMEIPEPGAATHKWTVEAGPEGLPIGIRDPEGKLHQRTDSLVPPDVAAEYDARIKSHQTVRGEQESDAMRRIQAQQAAATTADERKNANEGNKLVRKATKEFQDADEGLRLMQDYAARGARGDAQADRALLSTHIAMTLRKAGVRPTENLIQDAETARGLGDSIMVQLGKWTEGTTLSDQQRKQMVNLGIARRAETLSTVQKTAEDYGTDLNTVAPGVVKRLQGKSAAGTPPMPAPSGHKVGDVVSYKGRQMKVSGFTPDGKLELEPAP